jgi:hypothetical protein
MELAALAEPTTAGARYVPLAPTHATAPSPERYVP